MARLLVANALAAVVLLAGCPDGKSTATPPTTPAAPASPAAPAAPAAPDGPAAPAAPAPKPDEGAGALDPMYDSLRPGETYVVRTDFGNPITSRQEVRRVDPESVTFRLQMEIPNTTAEPQDQTQSRRAGPFEQRLAAHATPEKVLRRETLTISGIAFDCRVVEEDHPLLPGEKVTSWKCEKRYPGLVKQVDGSGKVVHELVEVVAPK
jgi:hypothetical protein